MKSKKEQQKEFQTSVFFLTHALTGLFMNKNRFRALIETCNALRHLPYNKETT
jgi:hypothetical protein